MKRLIPTGLVAAIALVAVVVISGCGGSGSNAATASTQANPVAAKRTSIGATIGVANGPLGKHLVDGSGRTLYLFEADKPNRSMCNTSCLGIWPSYSTMTKPIAKGDGVLDAKIGMAKAQNGKSIVTYNGHPLYYYAADQAPGDTGGQGLDQFGAKWYVVNPAGNKIDDD